MTYLSLISSSKIFCEKTAEDIDCIVLCWWDVLLSSPLGRAESVSVYCDDKVLSAQSEFSTPPDNRHPSRERGAGEEVDNNVSGCRLYHHNWFGLRINKRAKRESQTRNIFNFPFKYFQFFVVITTIRNI